jgi:hypothetical protein
MSPVGATTGISSISSIRMLSDYSADFFNDFGAFHLTHTGVMTFQPDTDEAHALLGLDNGALVSGLLQHHSNDMGRKTINSVSVYMVDDNGLKE